MRILLRAAARLRYISHQPKATVCSQRNGTAEDNQAQA